MTVQQIMDTALGIAHTKESQVGSANLLRWFNISRKRIGSLITQSVDENYFSFQWNLDAVASQAEGEYTLPAISSTDAGIVKIDKVLMKGYSTDDLYQPCNEVKLNELGHDWTWYLSNTPKSNPIYRLGPKSIFLAPQFATTDIVVADNDQIELHGTKKLVDLTAVALEALILIQDDVQWCIAEYMVPFILRARGKKSEATNAINGLGGVASELVATLTNRTRDFQEANVPDESNLGFGEDSFNSWPKP